jgi:uncharacterized protein with HEPN domain
MNKDPLNRVRHVLEEIAYLETLKLSKTAEQFYDDATAFRAAAYSLQNISEAVRNIPQFLLDDVSGIAWAKIKGFGNFTRYEYFRVDPVILWQTIAYDLDELQSAMEYLLIKFEEPKKQ